VTINPLIRRVAAPLATGVLVVLSAQVLWNSFERSKVAGQSVEHTYRVLVSSERFLSTIRDLESSVRGYVLTRNPNMLASYEADLAVQARILADLQGLTKDNPRQQLRLKGIEALTKERLDAMAEGLQVVQAGRMDVLSGMIQRGKGGRIMTELTARLAEFEEEEHRLLAVRTNAADDAVSRARIMLLVTASLLALALLFGGAIVERDVRSRELAYQALRRQADLIDFSHDAIITLDPAGVISGWNAGAMEIYGWSSAEAVGRRAEEILHAANLPADIQDLLATTERWDGELTQTAKDGRVRIVESRYVQVRNRSGAPIGVLNISRDATQRKRAEEMLAQVAEQRRLALDAAQLGSWDYHVAKDQVLWDERCRDIMGVPGLGPVSFEKGMAMIHPEEREAARADARRALAEAGDGRFARELRILLRDGTVRWVATYGRIYFEEVNGVRRPVRVIGVNSDITERKRVEQDLRESEDRLRVALDTGRIGIFNYLPLEDKILFDERARELLGVASQPDISVAAFLEAIHAEDRPHLIAARNSDLAGSVSDPGEVRYRIVRPDGAVRWMIARRRVYFEGEGQRRRAVRVLGVLLDITAQKHAEEELAVALLVSDRERRRLAALLETMPAGILLLDRANRVLEVNAEAIRIWQAQSFQELAARWRSFKGWRADTGEALQAEDWPAARALQGEKILGETIDIERFDGGRGTIFKSASPVRDAAGEIQGAVSVMVDITEQRQIELALRRSEERLRSAHAELEKLLEQKNILFQEVQHRVKNNLQVISSLLSLEAQRFEDRDFHKALNESRDRVRSMAMMHEKFYHLDDLARIEFADYVDELVRYFFSSYIAEPSAIGFSSHVDVRLNMDDAIPCGLILQELLSNSVKHAFPKGRGEIRIDFHSSNGKFKMCYRDSGVGLPPRVNLANPETLGLQLVTDLATQLGGNLHYEYQQGAKFTLVFG